MLKASKLFKILFWLFLIILVLNTKNIMKKFYPIAYSDTIYKYSNAYGLDPYLICGMIKTESNFNPDAVSNKSARGMMQITDPTAEWIAEQLQIKSPDTHDPEVNIKMGCYYMDYLLNMYGGNTKNALSAYNAGFNAVDRWLSDPSYSSDGKVLKKIPYRETELYVTKVLNNRRIYDILYDPE